MGKLTTWVIALLASGLIAAGCGNNENAQEETGANAPVTEGEKEPATDETTINPEGEATSEGGEQLEVAADPGGALKFEKDKLSAKAGPVTITMPNPSDVPHAIGVRGEGTDETGETVTKGSESTVSIELPAGEYEFYCPVAGHDAAGMKGTLTVK